MTPAVSALMMYGGVALLSAIIVFLDWLGRRKDRRTD